MEQMLQTLQIGTASADIEWASDEAFLNEPQIWPTFSHAVATELCLETGAGSLSPVSKLEEFSEAFKPLQVFFHERDLTGTTVTKLSKRQTKIVDDEEGGRPNPASPINRVLRQRSRSPTRHVRRCFSRVRLNPFGRRHLPGTQINLDDVIHVSNVVNVLTFYQSTSRVRKPTADGEINSTTTHASSVPAAARLPYHNIQSRSMQFVVEEVYARKFDARKLLGCRLKVTRRTPWKRGSSVKMILETYFATRIHCLVKYATTFPEHTHTPRGEWQRRAEVHHCPIAYRYADLKIDRDGVIDDVTVQQSDIL